MTGACLAALVALLFAGAPGGALAATAFGLAQGGLPAVPAAIPPADTAQVRTFPVTVVVDASFRSVRDWDAVVRSTVERASQEIFPLTGIRFTVREEIVWDRTDNSTALNRILEEGRAAFGNRDELVAIFSGPRAGEAGDLVTMGYAYLGRQVLVVAPHRTDRFVAGDRHGGRPQPHVSS